MNYYETAEKIQGERRVIALELGAHLDTMACKLTDLAFAEGDSKEYCSLMRIYLAAQKQFENLLPPVTAEEKADALKEFNAPSIYDERGILTL